MFVIESIVVLICAVTAVHFNSWMILLLGSAALMLYPFLFTPLEFEEQQPRGKIRNKAAGSNLPPVYPNGWFKVRLI
jgi:hypothetical protein